MEKEEESQRNLDFKIINIFLWKNIQAKRKNLYHSFNWRCIMCIVGYPFLWVKLTIKGTVLVISSGSLFEVLYVRKGLLAQKWMRYPCHCYTLKVHNFQLWFLHWSDLCIFAADTIEWNFLNLNTFKARKTMIFSTRVPLLIGHTTLLWRLESHLNLRLQSL